MDIYISTDLVSSSVAVTVIAVNTSVRHPFVTRNTGIDICPHLNLGVRVVRTTVHSSRFGFSSVGRFNQKSATRWVPHSIGDLIKFFPCEIFITGENCSEFLSWFSSTPQHHHTYISPFVKERNNEIWISFPCRTCFGNSLQSRISNLSESTSCCSRGYYPQPSRRTPTILPFFL